MGCKECGKPKCNGECGCKSPKVLQINNPAEYITFHKVSIPAAMGDSTTNPPKIGAYRNALVYYEADHTSWMYSTDGIPTKLTNGLTDYNEAVNLPQINGETLIGDKSGAELGLQDKLIAGDNIQIAADGKTISAIDTTYTAGENIQISDENVISATDTTYTAGDGIEINSDNEISAKIGRGLEFNADGEINVSEDYIIGFDTVADMQSSTNLVDGSFVRTLGYYAKNDGGGAIYLIREPEESETANGITTFAVDSLIAEWVNTDIYINLKQLGLSTSLADNSPIIQYAVTNNAGASVLFVPQGGKYACGSAVDIANKAITVKGTSSSDYNDPSATTLVFASSNGFTNCRNATFKDLCIKGDTATPANIGISGGACVDNCVICYFQTGISCSYQGPSIINNCNIHNNNGSGITNPVDSRITNNTINSNGGSGINLQAGANDNIICNNKIEWNGGIGISNYNANHNIINGNIIDRSGNTGCYIGGNSSHNVLTDNVFRRNGATGSSYNASNIHLNGANNGSTFANNITLTGNSLDDGSGITVPDRSIYIDDATTNPILLLNNTLTGGTNATPVYKTNSSNVTIIDSKNPVYESLLIKKDNFNVPANGTRDFSIPFHDVPAQYGQGTYRKLVITTRNASDAGYGIKEIYVMLYQQHGSYKVAFSDTTVRTNITLSGAYDADNQAVIVTVTSADATQYQVCMNTYSN